MSPNPEARRAAGRWPRRAHASVVELRSTLQRHNVLLELQSSERGDGHAAAGNVLKTAFCDVAGMLWTSQNEDLLPVGPRFGALLLYVVSVSPFIFDQTLWTSLLLCGANRGFSYLVLSYLS